MSEAFFQRLAVAAGALTVIVLFIVLDKEISVKGMFKKVRGWFK